MERKLQCERRNAECEMSEANDDSSDQFRIPHFTFRIYYSYRSATIGSRLAARRAGQMPKNNPTIALKMNATRMAKKLMDVFQCAILDSPTAPSTPNRIPISPPTRHSTKASTRNWNRMLK